MGDDASAPLLVLSGVNRVYRRGEQSIVALADIDLTIEAGEFVAIIGPSGSGKSTLLNVLDASISRQGAYRVAGRPVAALSPDALAQLRRHMFGFVFQGYNLLPRLSARANVELPAIYANTSKKERRSRANLLLERLGLADRLNHRPTQLSGGQQQRVSIARALINDVAVLLADEPTGALDAATGKEILDLFRTLADEGHTVLIVTHDSHVAARADRIIEISDGQIIADRVVRIRDRGRVAPIHSAPTRNRWIRQTEEAVRSAARTLGVHPLRNALTIMGIVVGIAAVSLSFAIGEGAKKQVLKQIGSFGTDTIQIFPGSGLGQTSPRTTETLSVADLERFSSASYLAGATPKPSAQLTLRLEGKALAVTAYGVSASFFATEGIPIVAGRPFAAAAIENYEAQLVIDDRIRAKLFPPGQDPIGSIVLIGKMPARVIGVTRLPEQSEYGRGLFVAMPYSTFVYRVSGQANFTQLVLRPNEGMDRPIVLAAIKKFLRSWHGRADFFIVDFQAIRQSFLRTQTILNLVIGTGALITLAIGGIGVTNMMLVSVAERTREIGIMIAVGARRFDIVSRFLIEAVFLCVGGGILGAGLAYAGGVLIVFTGAPIAYEFSWYTVAIAVISSTAAGLIAGVWPARRAARINPVEALAR